MNANKLAARFSKFGFTLDEVIQWSNRHADRRWTKARSLFKKSNADAYVGGPGGEWWRVLGYFADGTWDYSDDEFYPVDHALIQQANHLYQTKFNRHDVVIAFERLQKGS